MSDSRTILIKKFCNNSGDLPSGLKNNKLTIKKPLKLIMNAGNVIYSAKRQLKLSSVIVRSFY